MNSTCERGDVLVDAVSVGDYSALGGHDGAGVGVAAVVEADHVAAQAVAQHAVHLHAVFSRPARRVLSSVDLNVQRYAVIVTATTRVTI